MVRSLAGALLCALPMLQPGSVAAGAGSVPGADPAPLRLKLLAEMDARIDAQAARAHLEARTLLDQVVPIAFFGVVAEPVDAGMKVTQIYPATAAEASGIKVGDVLVEFAGVKTDSKVALFRTIRCQPVGEKLDFKVKRDGRELVLSATPGTRAEEDEEDEEQFPDLTPPEFKPRGLPVTFDFEKEAVGATPATVEQLLSGAGKPPRFVVARVKSGAAAPAEVAVLRQEEADTTGLRFPMALLRDVDVADVTGRVRFRLVGGVVDRAAGIVLRFKDAANYLVARVNSIEGDLRIFRVVNGLRRTLPGGVANLPIRDGEWHTLEFTADGAKIGASLDGKVVASSFDTFFLHGRVGIWTKSDSQTEFDELSFSAPAR